MITYVTCHCNWHSLAFDGYQSILDVFEAIYYVDSLYSQASWSPFLPRGPELCIWYFLKLFFILP